MEISEGILELLWNVFAGRGILATGKRPDDPAMDLREEESPADSPWSQHVPVFSRYPPDGARGWRSHHHEDAGSVVTEPHVRVDAVHPEVDVPLSLEGP